MTVISSNLPSNIRKARIHFPIEDTPAAIREVIEEELSKLVMKHLGKVENAAEKPIGKKEEARGTWAINGTIKKEF